MSPIETAPSSVAGSSVLDREQALEIKFQEQEFPSWQVIRQQTMEDLERAFRPEPYVVDWQMSPSENQHRPRAIKLRFGRYARDGKPVEHPYSRIIKRLASNHWNKIDVSFDSETQTGELRRDTIHGNMKNILANFNINPYKPELAVVLTDNLENSRERLEAVLNAMELAVQDEANGLKGRQDSFSCEQLYLLRTVNPSARVAASA